MNGYPWHILLDIPPDVLAPTRSVGTPTGPFSAPAIPDCIRTAKNTKVVVDNVGYTRLKDTS